MIRYTLEFSGPAKLCPIKMRGPPPKDWSQATHSGRTLRGFEIYLRSVQNIPVARLSDVLRDLLAPAASHSLSRRAC
jgi:hypothetical protein